MKLDRAGVPFLIATALIALLGGWLGYLCGIPGLVLFLFCLHFFRDPERPVPHENAYVSPADGKVILIRENCRGGGMDPPRHFISIFMNVFDVHVNRAPMSGTITMYKYFPGRFRPAFEESASLVNERNLVRLEDGDTRVEFSQVAGILARRIVFRKKEGDRVEKGERIGMIRFGSRVDLWLPPESRVAVRVGDRVRAASSIIAEVK